MCTPRNCIALDDIHVRVNERNDKKTGLRSDVIFDFYYNVVDAFVSVRELLVQIAIISNLAHDAAKPSTLGSE